ncbi:MAG: hypothetical protein GY703_22600 [Gammaproteobacteria bacterium]|nr:hypothetical protein [Gammaproteobacteria bacterium]
MKTVSCKIDLALHPSLKLGIFVGLIHSLALGLLLWLGSVHSGVLLCAPLVLFSGFNSWRTHGNLKGARAVCRVEWRQNGQWVLFDRSNAPQSAELSDGTVWPWLLVLRFTLGRLKKRYVIVLDGSAPTDEIRRLRARLRENADNQVN